MRSQRGGQVRSGCPYLLGFGVVRSGRIRSNWNNERNNGNAGRPSPHCSERSVRTLLNIDRESMSNLRTPSRRGMRWVHASHGRINCQASFPRHGVAAMLGFRAFRAPSVHRSHDSRHPSRRYTRPMARRKDISASDKVKVLKRDNYTCQMCGGSPSLTPGLELHVDHIVPASKGGAYEIDNYQTLCGKCNRGKGNTEGLDRTIQNQMEILLRTVNLTNPRHSGARPHGSHRR
jgi:5-methylcytosine-specific restriction endonuclease McrA